MNHVAPSALPQWDYPKYEAGEPVALFVPCYIDQFYPEIGRATVQLLRALNLPVEFPEGQTCCGQPAFNSGYWEQAQCVARQLAGTFAPYRWVVCPSASCTAMCRVFFRHLEPEGPLADVGSRVFELTEFLVEVLHVTDLGAVFPHKVTLHIGCHGRRELGLVAPPIELLRHVRGLVYCELPNIEECCGFGGTFSVKMPGTSIAMGRTKAANIVKSGADVVTSCDVSCLMHIGGIMRRDPAMRHIRTMHIAEILVSRENAE